MALEIASRLHDLGAAWFEESLPQNARAGIEELARKSSVAVAYGEHMFGREGALEALRRRRLSVLQTRCLHVRRHRRGLGDGSPGGEL